MGAQTEDVTDHTVPESSEGCAASIVVDVRSHSYDADNKVIEGKISLNEVMAVKKELLALTNESVVTFSLNDDAASPCYCPLMDVKENEVRLNPSLISWSIKFTAKNVTPEIAAEVGIAQCFNVEGSIIRDKMIKAGYISEEGTIKENTAQNTTEKADFSTGI